MTPASDLLARALLGDVAWIRTQRWEPHVILAAADHHGIGPLVWHALRAAGERPPGLYDALAAARHGDVTHELVRTGELARVTAALEARDVPALLLKGAALAYTVYPEPWLRPRVDTDIFVAQERFGAADRALREAGYVPAPTVSTGDFVSHQVPYEYRDRHGLTHVIDLHWKAVNPRVLADALPFPLLWADALAINRAALHARAPSHVASLLVSCVHRLGHHQDNERLVWLYDIHLLCGALDAGGWDRVVAMARERAICAVVRSGLLAAASRFHTAVPPEALAALGEPFDEPSRAYTERRQRRVDVLRADLRLLPTWRDRVQLVAEHAFPPASFMRSRYAARRRALLPLLYVHRLATGAWKWFRVS